MNSRPFNWSFAGVGVGLLAFALVLPPDPGLSFSPVPYKASEEPEGYTTLRTGEDGKLYTRRTIYVDSAGEKLHCWLFLPADSSKPAPLFVVAHGFGTLKSVADVDMAEILQERGMAALTFDYRGWGPSGGAPRHVINAQEQLKDFRAVLEKVVSSQGFEGAVDASRINLIGTSYAGGHVLTLSALLAREMKTSDIFPRLRSVTAIVPFLDGKAQIKQAAKGRPLLRSLRYAAAIFADVLRGAVSRRLQPIWLQIGGQRDGGNLAAMELAEKEFKIWQKAEKIAKETGGWANNLAARSLFNTLYYRPISTVGEIRTPTLIVEAEQDETCITGLAAKAVETINTAAPKGAPPLAELKKLPINHFETHEQPHLSRILDLILAFAKRNGGTF